MISSEQRGGRAERGLAGPGPDGATGLESGAETISGPEGWSAVGVVG